MSANTPSTASGPSAVAESPVAATTHAPALGNGSTAAPGAHGAPPRPSRLPQSQKYSKLYRWALPGGGVLCVAIALAVWLLFFRSAQGRTDLVSAAVTYHDLQLKVMERGTLEAVENHDIKCEVKPGSRGAPKIMWVVDNGQVVEKGDLLVDIDDSALVEQADNQKIALDKAESDMIASEQNYPITEANLKQWDEGDYPATREDYKGQIQNSDACFQQQKDRAAWVARMVKKGYMTVSQEESERANEEGCRLDLEKKKTQLEVLEKYTNPTKHKTNYNAVVSAKADLESKTLINKQAKKLYDELLLQIKQCKVYAPNSGVVVYATSEQTRTGVGATQSIIAQGEPVAFGQKLMSIPDLDHMQVNVRVHEAFINHMDVKPRIEDVTSDGPADKAGLKKGDVIVKLGNKPVTSTVTLMEALRHTRRDKVKVQVLRDGQTEEVEVTLAKPENPQESSSGSGSTPARGVKIDPNAMFGVMFQSGLPASVRVANLPGRTLKAHVKSVSSVAAQQDWMSPDVKVYQAYIEIDDSVKDLNLKPGLSADCTIFTEETANHVLAIPVQSVIGPLEKGGKPRCFVMTPKGPEQREIELGLSDDKYFEVKDGLNDGDQVVLSPRELLSGKEKKGATDDSAGDAKGSGSGSGRGGRGGRGGPPPGK